MVSGIAAFCATFLFLMPSGPMRNGTERSEEARAAEERAKALAAAQKAEAEERARALARIRLEQRNEQARMFSQRHNTDRTPVGTVGASAPAAAPPPTGFSVVRPALPPGQSGGGFREVKIGRPNGAAP